MILNKASFERGFSHACVHKTVVREGVSFGSGGISSLSSPTSQIADIAQRGKDNHTVYEFGILATDKKANSQLDPDGLPPVGALLEEGDPVFR